MAPPSTLPGLLLLAGVVILAAILLRRSYRYYGRRRRGRREPPLVQLPRPSGRWGGTQTDAAAQLAKREIEMYELYRQLSAQLDNKIVVLQQLMAQSEEVMRRLDSLLPEDSKAGQGGTEMAADAALGRVSEGIVTPLTDASVPSETQ